MWLLCALASLGLAVSAYAYYVERSIRKNATFKPACDISDRISCSKPIKSSYGNMFFISNALLGMLFYACVIVLNFFNAYQLILFLSAASCCASLFLAYLLFFKIRSVCILCISVYIINFLLLITTLKIIYFQ